MSCSCYAFMFVPPKPSSRIRERISTTDFRIKGIKGSNGATLYTPPLFIYLSIYVRLIYIYIYMYTYMRTHDQLYTSWFFIFFPSDTLATGEMFYLPTHYCLSADVSRATRSRNLKLLSMLNFVILCAS